ncbi:glycosyltransferase family 2 protein [candidate division KSB1 bacterium]|nr:glycosyltransferase family 2 protein [candidate division KSB1 bacterium]
MKQVTVGIINFNGESVLADTLDSVLAQDYPEIKAILVVDDGSNDRSAAMVRNKYPHVRVIELGENRGPNPVRNRALQESTTEYVLLMDNDIVMDKDVIRLLVEALEAVPDSGVVSAQIRFREDPHKIQYNGVLIHYTAGAVMNTIESDHPIQVRAVSGGTILVDREKAFKIGLFDEDFYSGWEDGDFAFRMGLAGYPVLIMTRAHVYHKKEATGLARVAFQVRNRWWFIYKNFSWRTIILISPALLLNQIAVGLFMTMKGQLGGFLKGNFDAMISIGQVLRKRKKVMEIKQVRDRDLLTGESVSLIGDVAPSGPLKTGLQLMNGFFKVYWWLVKWAL